MDFKGARNIRGARERAKAVPTGSAIVANRIGRALVSIEIVADVGAFEHLRYLDPSGDTAPKQAR
jgi:hypothetical protein